VKDGKANDLAALQACSDACDTAGGGTIVLGKGTYFIGTGTWKIGSANAQHHINIEGVNPNSTIINSSVTGTTAAIYFNIEKYVHANNFSLFQTGTPKTGYGIVLGGDAVSGGSETNGVIFDQITISAFDHNIDTQAVNGTSSEITFNQLTSSNGHYGFYSNNFNALNFVFTNLQTGFNDTAGVNIETGNITVIGGAAHGNAIDFAIHSTTDGASAIIGFRSETSTLLLDAKGQGGISLIASSITGMTNPNSTNAITTRNCALTIKGCKIGGQISYLPGAGGSLNLEDNSIIDPMNTWTLSNQIVLQGPGFRMANNGAGGVGSKWVSKNNKQCNNNTDTVIGYWSNAEGVVSATGQFNLSTAIALNQGQGPALTITNNAIVPIAYQHHIGAGLIKNINPPPEMLSAVDCIQLIPDAAFTTDKTGNIAKASTAIAGQLMTLCFDPSTTKWYPSY
jgi:hypothetical protein